MSCHGLDWTEILAVAREIVGSYETPVTLRQIHYWLVSVAELGYPNVLSVARERAA